MSVALGVAVESLPIKRGSGGGAGGPAPFITLVPSGINPETQQVAGGDMEIDAFDGNSVDAANFRVVGDVDDFVALTELYTNVDGAGFEFVGLNILSGMTNLSVTAGAGYIEVDSDEITAAGGAALQVTVPDGAYPYYIDWVFQDNIFVGATPTVSELYYAEFANDFSSADNSVAATSGVFTNLTEGKVLVVVKMTNAGGPLPTAMTIGGVAGDQVEGPWGGSINGIIASHGAFIFDVGEFADDTIVVSQDLGPGDWALMAIHIVGGVWVEGLGSSNFRNGAGPPTTWLLTTSALPGDLVIASMSGEGSNAGMSFTDDTIEFESAPATPFPELVDNRGWHLGYVEADTDQTVAFQQTSGGSTSVAVFVIRPTGAVPLPPGEELIMTDADGNVLIDEDSFILESED